MSTFIFLDSKFRSDLTESPAFFHIYTDQTINWPLNARTINVVPPTIYNQPPDFLSQVEICDLFIFYDGVAPEPFIKINFSNTEFNDVFLINTLDDRNDIKFIARLQKDYTTGWIRYTCKIRQAMRFKRKGSFVFRVLDKDNNVLNVGTNGRITALIDIKPFVLDYHQTQVRNVP